MNIEKVITDHKQNIAIIYKVSLRKLSIQYWDVLKATDVDHRDRYLFNPCSNPSLLNYFKFWSVDQGKLWKNQDGFLKSPRSWTAIVFNLQPHGLLGYKLSHFYARGSSWPRDRTCVSCISCTGRWILYHWPSWEGPNLGWFYLSLTQ